MKFISLNLVLVLCALSSIAQENNFKISGIATQDIGNRVYLIINSDTIQSAITNKQFVFEGYIDGPVKAIIRSDKNCSSQFFIEPGEMQLSTTSSQLNGTCYLKNQLTGSAIQLVFEEYLAGYKKITEKNKGVYWDDKMKEYSYEFVSKHPSSVVATHIVQTSSRGFGLEWTQKAFNALSEDQRNSLQGTEIQSLLGQRNLMKVGNSINDLTQKDIHDSLFHLSSLKGHYVLIDFWASWCVPCRKENPNVKKVYEKYHSQGFEVVGVSLDSDGNKWKEAVQKDDLPWIHISDLKGWNNEIASAFEIHAIPSNILIDKEGKIIAINLRGNALERAVKKLFNSKD